MEAGRSATKRRLALSHDGRGIIASSVPVNAETRPVNGACPPCSAFGWPCYSGTGQTPLNALSGMENISNKVGDNRVRKNLRPVPPCYWPETGPALARYRRPGDIGTTKDQWAECPTLGGFQSGSFRMALIWKSTLTGVVNLCSSSIMDVAAQCRLRSTLERLAGSVGRSWVGTKPTGDSVIAMIASNVGLNAHGREADFHSLPATDASIWLTLFATQSLLHGEVRIPEGTQEEISECLRALGSDAQFFSKGVWEQTRRLKHYEPVSSESGWDRRRHRLFFRGNSDPLPPIDVLEDGGLIGFDCATAFIFWVEEDD